MLLNVVQNWNKYILSYVNTFLYYSNNFEFSIRSACLDACNNLNSILE
jgi:hypothetical protein